MSYQSIPLPATVPARVRHLIEAHVEPYLADVRAMLEHPKQAGDPAFNFSIVTVLSAVVGGLSRAFYPKIRRDRASFREVAILLAKADDPESTAGEREIFAEQFYSAYRCFLVHSLGLYTDRDDQDDWKVAEGPVARKVCRHHSLPLGTDQLRDLDSVGNRPEWLGRVLTCEDGTYRLNADALYWAVRRLVLELAMDNTRSADAEAWLARLPKVAT